MGWLRDFTDGEVAIFAAAAARDRAVLFLGRGDDAFFFLEPVPAPFFVLAVTLALVLLVFFGDFLLFFTGLGDLHARWWVSTPIVKLVGRMVLVGRIECEERERGTADRERWSDRGCRAGRAWAWWPSVKRTAAGTNPGLVGLTSLHSWGPTRQGRRAA